MKHAWLKWNAIIAAAAILVAVIRPIGRYTDLFQLWRIGNLSAMSPEPTAFAQVIHYGPGDLWRQRAVACESESGMPKLWHVWDDQFREAISGPHRRTVVFVNLLNSLTLVKNRPGVRNVFDTSMRYYFCHGGELATLAGCEPQAKSVHIRWYDMHNGQWQAVEVSTPCAG